MTETSRMGSWCTWYDVDDPPRVGVSSCLLGQEVRHDGGHTRNVLVADVLGACVRFEPVCPEMGIGLGVPRPTIRLVDDDGEDRLVCPSTKEDLTDKMRAFASREADRLRGLGLAGYVLKKDSPSCGIHRIRVSTDAAAKGQVARRDGVGLFAAELMRALPELPVEEEGRLNDTGIREDFVERLFANDRLTKLVASEPSRHDLVRFHTAHKSMLFTRDDGGSRELGTFLGEAGSRPHDELVEGYADRFRTIFARRSSVGRHVNVLHHAMGHLKRILTSAQKQELLGAIEAYRRGTQPRSVALTLMAFLARSHQVDYLLDQLYFEPCPKELLPGDRLQRAWSPPPTDVNDS